MTAERHSGSGRGEPTETVGGVDRATADGRADGDETPAGGEISDESRDHAAGASAEGESSELVGADLAVGYPGTDEPVVECAKVILPAGEVTALVGPNGSGKSTLLKAMANQLAPDRGTIRLDGADLQSTGSKELARRLGLLSQENTSPGSLTVEDLAYHGRYPHRGFFDSLTAADHAAVDRAIDLAGVEQLRESELNNLSGGQKQLAWIAMVLAQDTDVLLLDEPTTFLDLHHQLRVMDVIQTLNREAGVTVGVVLHDITQAVRFADYLVALKDGDIYDWGPPEETVTEDLLADVFGVDARVELDRGEPRVIPRRALD